MADSKQGIPEAKSEYASGGPKAEARGDGAAAASGRKDTLAQGRAAAAVSRDGSAQALLTDDDAKLEQIRADIQGFSEPFREAIEACLKAAVTQQVALDRLKETVDDLWAQNAAASLRKGLMTETFAKSTIEAALTLGLESVGRLFLPKGE